MAGANDRKYAVLWSGGKDSCLALWQARVLGLQIAGIVNFFEVATNRVRFHAVRTGLIAEQSRALGLELLQCGTTVDSYATVFAETLHQLRVRGYDGVIAGDLHLENVRQWNEEQSSRAGLRLVEPLWHSDGILTLKAFITLGFRAVLTCCDDRWPDILWPGREIDGEFVEDVSKIFGLDVCGENGEYHSFVFDGPLFSRQINWAPGETRLSNGFSQMDLVSGSAECHSALSRTTS